VLRAWARQRERAPSVWSFAALLSFALTLCPACSRREPFLTYFDGAHAVSLRYPASWRTTPADPATSGAAFRYFRPRESKPGITASLLSASLGGGTLDTYARALSSGKTVSALSEIKRGSGAGLVATYADAEGRYGLVLLAQGQEVRGLLVQGDETSWKSHGRAVDEMMASFQSERAADYVEHREARFGLAFRLPSSWRETQGFAKGDMMLRVFASPAVGVGDNRQLLHASLTVTVEPIGTGGFAGYYDRKRAALGEAFPVVRHEPWKAGYADTIVTETAVMTSRIKRFYGASSARGYCLAFEASEDVYRRVAPWFDFIADTLEVS
jgi:hypothetical protein